MKKYIGIVLALIYILALTACGNTEEIMLPESEDIREVEIIKNTSKNVKRITDKEEISKLISDIKDNSKSTNIESVSDQPTNIDIYNIIKFYHKDAEGNPSIAYIYKNKDICYIEQPYSGIWIIKDEVFDNINSNLN